MSDFDAARAAIRQARVEMLALNRNISMASLSLVRLTQTLNPPPLWTRHMLGVREAERDRRRHGRV